MEFLFQNGWEVPFNYLSFNDPIVDEYGYETTLLGGSNYNLIIDGEEKWARGKGAQSIEKITDGEYFVYQMWFLDKDFLSNKEDFEITLNDIVVALGEEYIPIEGSFQVEVSKEKALNNTTTIIPQDDTTLKYKSMEKLLSRYQLLHYKIL